MIISYLALIVLLLIPFPKVKSFIKNEYHEDYLKPDATLPIKGFFVVLVFFRHSREYVTLSVSILNLLFLYIDHYSGQLIVAAFLFYSGYGIYESIKTKGTQYIKSFPRKRLFRTWIRFAVCVSFFLVFNLAANIVYPVKTILLSYTGWESIGNSNWYMCVVFILYIVTYISFRFISDKKSLLALLIFTFLSILIIAILFVWGPGHWWYNTILCWVIGMWYSRYKEKIDSIVQKNNITYWLTFLSSILCFSALYYLLLNCFGSILMILAAPVLVLIIIILSMKVQFKSTLLAFLGKHVFSIYILQRLALSLLRDLIPNNAIYLLSSFLLTILFAYSFDTLFKLFEDKLCKTKTVVS